MLLLVRVDDKSNPIGRRGMLSDLPSNDVGQCDLIECGCPLVVLESCWDNALGVSDVEDGNDPDKEPLEAEMVVYGLLTVPLISGQSTL